VTAGLLSEYQKLHRKCTIVSCFFRNDEVTCFSWEVYWCCNYNGVWIVEELLSEVPYRELFSI